VLQALAGTSGQALPESLRPRASALSPHQVRIGHRITCKGSMCLCEAADPVTPGDASLRIRSVALSLGTICKPDLPLLARMYT